jgi:hypothetical protein
MAAVEVSIDEETIKISIVIVGTNMSSAITVVMVAMTATIMTNAIVVVADMVVVVAMTAETLKEIVPNMYLEPMILVIYVSRWVTLH